MASVKEERPTRRVTFRMLVEGKGHGRGLKIGLDDAPIEIYDGIQNEVRRVAFVCTESR